VLRAYSATATSTGVPSLKLHFTTLL
jgi:hypothetical protein